MTKTEAVETIHANWPPEHYSMLREALTIAVSHLEQSSNSDYATCEGCKYLHGKCILNAPNNCIRDADDYYTIA